jgi:hypothetical protein
MKSQSSTLASLRFKRPVSHLQPFGFALAAHGAMTQAIDQFGLPVIPTGHNTNPLTRALYLLKAAAEIEHGLLVQYLYAAYSIDDVAVRKPLVNIAIQEMDHLLNVQNLARFLRGGTLYFDRANFPIPVEHVGAYPFPFQFERLSTSSLGKYVAAESPFPIQLVPEALRADVQNIWDHAAIDTHLKTPGHVGMLYAALFWLFCPDDANPGEWKGPFAVDALKSAGYGHLDPATDFATPKSFETFQGSASEFRGSVGPVEGAKHRVVWNVTSQGLARSCIAQIAEQGEGITVSNDSHFLEFFDLFNRFKALLASGGDPVRPFPTNPRAVDFPDAAKGWGQLFNNRYRMLLLKLTLALSQAPGTTGPSGRDELPDHLLDEEMKGIAGITGLTESLASRGGSPPFELPDDSALFGLPDGQLPVELAAVKKGIIALIDQVKTLVAALPTTGPGAPTAGETTALSNMLTDDDALRATLVGN